MKVAIYCPEIRYGGAERFSVNLAAGFVKLNYEVFLLTKKKQEGEYELAEGIRRRTIFLTDNVFQNIWRLRSFLKTEDIDVCVAVGIYANICSGAANWGLRTKMILCERNAPAQDVLSIWSRLARKLTYWRGDGFVFQTEGAKAFYSRRIQSRSTVIPNLLKEGLPYRSNVHKKEIVAVGRLMPQKNYPLLLKAFAKVCEKNSEYILRIFGQGMLEHELKKMAMDLKIDHRVVFEGFCENVHEKIMDSDIYVLSSDFEGMPNALMEVMAMGFPVIATDCPAGGPRELISNGRNGILIPIGDHEKMGNVILELIEHEEKKEAIALLARELREKCGAERIIAQWVKFLSESV